MYMGVYKYNMVVVGAQIIICVHRGKEDKALDKVKYRNEISPKQSVIWTAVKMNRDVCSISDECNGK